MPEERIVVVVQERGSRTVQRRLRNIGGAAKSSGSAVSALQRLLVAFGGVAVVGGLVRVVDTYTDLQNRLRVVTEGTSQLKVVTGELFQIANKTRASFDATVQIYARAALSSKDLGIAQKELLQFTESLNQAVLISGANVRESNAALIQLSQALASNTLRGDELRTILEQLPVVADVIADHLSVTRGELRELGAQAQITATDIFDAFRGAREELAERFGETIVTVGRSFTILQNSLIRLAGEFDNTTGFSRTLSGAVLTLSDNTDTLGRSIVSLSIILGTVFAKGAVGSALRALKAVAVVIRSGPFAALAFVVSSVVSALYGFRDALVVSRDRAVELGDVFTVVFGDIGSALGSLVNRFGQTIRRVSGLFDDLTVGDAVRGALVAIVRYLDGLALAFKATYDILVALFFGIPAIFEALFNAVLTIFQNSSAFRVLRAQYEDLVSLFSGIPALFEGLFNAVLTSVQNSSILRIFRAQYDTLVSLFSGIPVFFGNLLNDVTLRFQDFLNLVIEGANQVSGLLGVSPIPELNFSEFEFPEFDFPEFDFPEFSIVGDAVDKLIQDIQRAIDSTREPAAGAIEAYVNSFFDRVRDVAEKRRLQEQEELAQLAAANAALAQVAGGIDFSTRQNPRFKRYLRDLEREAELLLLSNREYEIQGVLFRLADVAKRSLATSEIQFVRGLVQQVQLLREQNSILDDITGPLEEYEFRLVALNGLLGRGRITTEEFNDAQRDLRSEFLMSQQDLSSGIQRVFIDAQQGARDAATFIQDAFVTAFDSMADAFTNFVIGSKTGFRELVTSLLADLAKLFTRRALFQLLSLIPLPTLGAGASGLPEVLPLSPIAQNTGSLFRGAGGGLVSGPGTSISDSIRGMLSNGEFVVNARDTSQNLPALNRINQGGQPSSGGITVNSGPVYVTVEGGTGDQGLDEDQLEQIGSQIEREATDRILGVIIREQSPGGRLFGTGRTGM